MSNARWLSFVLAGLAAVPTNIHAQVRASEHAVVAQTVDGTTLTVEYSRPGARPMRSGSQRSSTGKPKT